MAAKLVTNFSPGLIAWKMTRDSDGHRNYRVTHRVFTDNALDGPAIVMAAAGLPLIGSTWNFGNDIDIWAFCQPDMVVSPDQTRGGEPHKYWKVEQLFSTRPRTERCQDTTIENPLLEPDRISGSFVKYVQEAQEDKDGNAVVNSAHQPIKGASVEIDFNRPTVQIEQNVAALGLETFSEMVDTVNDAPLWGLAARKIKLSNVSWRRKLYGTCTFYYTRNLEFDVDFNTFDRDIIDEGTMVIRGEWSGCEPGGTPTWSVDGGASSSDPRHFRRAVDCNENPISLPLNGSGAPNTSSTPASIPLATDSGGKVKFYGESDFTLLGIPLSL